MSIARFKLVFFSPRKNTAEILDHLFKKFPQDLGKIGQYEKCAFVTPGTGQFTPGPGTHPVVGIEGKLEFVEEDRVELVVNDRGNNEQVRNAIHELKTVHPYEEVAYDVYRMEDF